MRMINNVSFCMSCDVRFKLCEFDNVAIATTSLATMPPPQGKRPRLLYTIPTGQNPSGTTLSDERRVELYALACKHDLIILEDDPYVDWDRVLIDDVKHVFCVV